jgi:hypothetical protein
LPTFILLQPVNPGFNVINGIKSNIIPVGEFWDAIGVPETLNDKEPEPDSVLPSEIVAIIAGLPTEASVVPTNLPPLAIVYGTLITVPAIRGVPPVMICWGSKVAPLQFNVAIALTAEELSTARHSVPFQK